MPTVRPAPGGAPGGYSLLRDRGERSFGLQRPPVADFFDPEIVKVVELEEKCRQQQVNDGCFPSLSQVPKKALTLTIPALLSARFIYCVVPGPTKAAAVGASITGPVSTSCPASILRRHLRAVLYLDEESAALL